jgi:hypothetical protein
VTARDFSVDLIWVRIFQDGRKLIDSGGLGVLELSGAVGSV